MLIIDECTQSIEPGSLVPISKLKSDGRLIMLGDHKQLQPRVKYDMTKRMPEYAHKLQISLFERLIKEDKIEQIMLNIQYRMHSSMIKFSNDKF